MLLGVAFLAGTISTGHNAAFAQSTTLTQGTAGIATTAPTAGNPTAAPEQAGAETADGPDTPSNGTTADTSEPANLNETANETGTEVDNTAALQAQAKVTAEQAKQTALGKVPGTVVTASLEDENGQAVYTVTINPAAGGTNQDVKVDAVTGTLLGVEAGD